MLHDHTSLRACEIPTRTRKRAHVRSPTEEIRIFESCEMQVVYVRYAQQLRVGNGLDGSVGSERRAEICAAARRPPHGERGAKHKMDSAKDALRTTCNSLICSYGAPTFFPHTPLFLLYLSFEGSADSVNGTVWCSGHLCAWLHWFQCAWACSFPGRQHGR